MHPTIEGHRLIASLLTEQLIAMGFVEPTDGWELRRDESFETHYKSLGFAYFEHGRQRLEGLKYWTEGRAHGALPKEAKQPILIED